MAISGVEEMSLQLLEAYHDLAQGRLKNPVAKQAAVAQADIEHSSTEPEVALRYLLNGGYLEPIEREDTENSDETMDSYAITVPGMDWVRQKRNL
jgi:diketogulonate reductase-like aldo/keto reductase